MCRKGFANIALIIGLVVIVASVAVFMKQLNEPANTMSISERSNFLYVNGGGAFFYDGEQQYFIRIQNSKLVKYINEMDETMVIVMEDRNVKIPSGDPKLFIYDVTKNISREVSFEEVQRLKLDSHSKSPDGFELALSNHLELDDNSVYLVVRGALYPRASKIIKKLNIQLSESFHNFRFLGWIE